MGKGSSYRGGSTIVRPGSDWFSYQEPEPLAPPQVERKDPFKQTFQQQLAAIQAQDPPDTLSKTREMHAQSRELARQKKIDRRKALEGREALTTEEQKALGEQRRWAKIQEKFSKLDAELFRKPTE